MNSKRALLILGISAIFALTSCSGLKTVVCTTNCTVNGNATLNLTLSDTPPAGVGVISFTLPISGISLVPTTGSAVSVYSGGNFELTRLQSDSAPVAVGVPVPEGSYTAIKVTIGTSSGVFINASGGSITSSKGTCVANAVCALPPGAATSITFTFPSALTLSANQTQWIGLDFNLNNAITSSSGITVDFGQANVLTATTTAPVGISSGNAANIDDFTGIVKAISSSSITLNSTARGNLTASISSTTPVYDNDPLNPCSSGTPSCIKLGSIVSLQGVLTNAGVVDATSLDIINGSTTPADEVEGTIYPSTCNGGSNLGLILADSAVPSGNATLTGLSYGAGFCLTVSPTASFLVDTGFLPTGQLTAGFSNSSDIQAGQVVRVNVSNVVAGSVVDATATSLLLRYSRLSGTVNLVTGNNFTINGLPTYLGFTLSPLVATYSGSTIFEGATQVSDLSTNSPAVSIRALYLNSATASQGVPFLATKVRKH
jgi:hypothetical protein